MTEYNAMLKQLKELTGMLEELEDFLKNYKKLTEQCNIDLGFDTETQVLMKDNINQS